MTEATTKRGTPALIAIRLSALWVLAGAAMKLLRGTPMDLPEVVRDLTPFAIDTTYVLVIGVELSIVALAFLRPRWAWPILVGLFGLFDLILLEMMRLGADSCGCFGGSIKVDPRVMLAIDTVLLVALFATRPWKTLGRAGSSSFVLAPMFAASFLAPWLYIRARMDVTPTSPGNGGAAAVPGAAASNEFVLLRPENWVGKNVDEIGELTRWVDVAQVPLFGKIVLWRQGCSHCASHLTRMATEDDGSQPLLLVQIQDDLADGRAVEAMPQGPHVTTVRLPENLVFAVTTPWEIRVDGGVVTAALDEEASKAEAVKPP